MRVGYCAAMDPERLKHLNPPAPNDGPWIAGILLVGGALALAAGWWMGESLMRFALVAGLVLLVWRFICWLFGR
jgi:hypothetical protein